MHRGDEILLPDGRRLPYRRPEWRPVAVRRTVLTGGRRAASTRDRRAKPRGREQPGRVVDVEA